MVGDRSFRGLRVRLLSVRGFSKEMRASAALSSFSGFIVRKALGMCVFFVSVVTPRCRMGVPLRRLGRVKFSSVFFGLWVIFSCFSLYGVSLGSSFGVLPARWRSGRTLAIPSNYVGGVSSDSRRFLSDTRLPMWCSVGRFGSMVLNLVFAFTFFLQPCSGTFYGLVCGFSVVTLSLGGFVLFVWYHALRLG